MSDQNSLENVDPVDIELAALAKKLSNDPATRKDFLRLVKKHNPAQPIPELDVEDRISALAAPHIQKVAKLEADLLKRDVAGRIEEKRSALREQGYSRDDVAAIEKLMVEKQIPSHDTAASYFKMEKQTATPTPTSLQTGVNTLPIDRKAIKEAGGIRNWSRMEAHKAADEILKGRVKLH